MGGSGFDPGWPEAVAGGEGGWAREDAVIWGFGWFGGFGAFGAG